MSQQDNTADQQDPVEESNMSLMEHLIELRTRLMWVGAAVIIATLVAMIFAWDIVEILNQPLGGYIPQAIGPTDNLLVFFKVSLASGAAVAMPVIMYQLIAFVAPGLYPHERRTLILILPGAVVLFVTGVLFAFFIMIPPAVHFLQSFGGDNIRTEWTASLYIGFITRITFWIGVAFEAPLVIGFLARIGLISGSQLLHFWRQAVVIIAIAAAFITPTIDPVNMTIVMGPLIALFFFSVGIAYLLYKPREPRDFGEGFIPDEFRDDHDDSDDDSDDTPPDEPPEGTPPGASETDDETDDGNDEDADDSPEAMGESVEEETTEEIVSEEEASEEVASEEAAALEDEPDDGIDENTAEPSSVDETSQMDDSEEPEQSIAEQSIADAQDDAIPSDKDAVMSDEENVAVDDSESERESRSASEAEAEKVTDVDAATEESAPDTSGEDSVVEDEEIGKARDVEEKDVEEKDVAVEDEGESADDKKNS